MKSIQELDNLEQKGIAPTQLKTDYMALNQFSLKGSKKIYRVFSFERFLKVLINKNLTLVKPKLWDDPFENFVLKSYGVLSDGRKVHFDSMRESYYGQCWTLRKECDGLWRNYSPDSMGVKVRTTVAKLFDALYDIGNPYHTLSYFIGKVEYVSDKKIKNVFSDPRMILTSDGKGIVKTLLLKRRAFNYEKEVRIIFKVPNDNQADYSKVTNVWAEGDFFNINIDPNILFEEVEFNPWISDDLYKILSDGLEKAGYRGKVRKSRLYDQPQFVLKF